MIDLPRGPMQATPSFIDNGFTQRTALGGAAKRIDRKGSRYTIAVTAGPFSPEVGRDWIGCLMPLQRQGHANALTLASDQTA
ncbi:MAG: hypothetical protein AAFY81_10165, partial [Pseudomonadota bacterium]